MKVSVVNDIPHYLRVSNDMTCRAPIGLVEYLSDVPIDDGAVNFEFYLFRHATVIHLKFTSCAASCNHSIYRFTCQLTVAILELAVHQLILWENPAISEMHVGFE